MLERLLRANEDQAKSSGALVEIQRHHAKQLETLQEQARLQTMALTQIVDKLDVMDRSREAAIATITEHVDVAVSAGFSSSDGWWRKALWIAVGLIALSNIIGAGVGKLIELLK